jgi:hypothetical protein
VRGDSSGKALTGPSTDDGAHACMRLLFLVLREAGAETAGSAKTERTEGSVVGASVFHPAKWSVERERYTYGFTLWESESGLSHGHGGTPAVRVALAYGLRPGQIGPTVRESSQRTPTSR